MSVKIPPCMVCGKAGIDLGKVAGKDIVLCSDCGKMLLPKVKALVEASAPKRPAKAVERITPKKFREIVIASVEKRGSLNVLDAAKRYGLPAEKAREIVKALADEKGWQLEEAPRKLKIKKPA